MTVKSRLANSGLKKLVQVWVSETHHTELTKLSEEHLLPLATYLRQVFSTHIKAEKMGKKEMNGKRKGAAL